MTTATAAFAVIKARIAAAALSFPVRYYGEDGGALPDTPEPFAFVHMVTGSGYIAGYGNGRQSNLWRNPATVEAYVFVPNGWGADEATTRAETIAALFRSYRDADISCFEATVLSGGPGSDISVPGMNGPVDDYVYAVAEVGLHFDLVG